jgi:WD40 repeat protein
LPFWSASFSPDGRTIVTGGGPAGRPAGGLPGELIFWNADSGRKRVIRHPGSVRRAIWAADGSFIAVGDLSGITQAVQPLTGRPILNFSPPNDLLNGVALSRDGAVVASAGFGGSISLWDKSGREKRTLHFDQDQFVDAALSPDGQSLAVTTKGGKALLFDLARESEPVLLRACDDNQNAECVAFAPNGLAFATGAQEHLRVWESRSGRRQWEMANPAVITGVAYSPDGKFIATVDTEGRLTLRDPDSGEIIHSTPAHSSEIFGLAISPDGTRIATAGREDQTLKIWSAPTLELMKTLHR